MNTSKSKLVAPSSKIPTIKRPVPVGLKSEPAPSSIIKPKTLSSIPSTNQQITVPQTPKIKTTADSVIKASDVKVPVPQALPSNNKENKENLALNAAKKTQETKVKGYTELKKSEERLSELVHKFELEKQNFAQQIHATEHKYKNDLKTKDETIKHLQNQLELASKQTRGAEDELNAVNERLNAVITRNKALEVMLERLGVDVVSLQPIATSTNIDEIETQYQEFKQMCEEGYQASLEFVKQQAKLLSCLSCDDIVIPSFPSSSSFSSSSPSFPSSSSSSSSELEVSTADSTSLFEISISTENNSNYEVSNIDSNSNFGGADSSFVAATEDMFDEEMMDVNTLDEEREEYDGENNGENVNNLSVAVE